MAKQILLVDDDTELCALMADFFSEHGFALDSAHDGRSGLARALEGQAARSASFSVQDDDPSLVGQAPVHG